MKSLTFILLNSLLVNFLPFAQLHLPNKNETARIILMRP